MTTTSFGEEGQVSGSNPSSTVNFNKYLCLLAKPLSECCSDLLWFQLKISVQESAGEHRKRKNGQNQRDEEHGSKLDCMFGTKGFPESSCCIATDSFIYSLGSSQHRYGGFGRSIRLFDLEHPEKEWKLGSSMKTSRTYGAAVVIDNKIYVFGGIHPTSPKKKPWAEVLDRDTSHWTGLADPPVNLRSDEFLAFVLDKSDACAKIFLCSLRGMGLYIYKVISDSWQVLNEKFQFVSRRSNPVLVENTLYWVGQQSIGAYDLISDEKFFGPIDSIEMERMLRGYGRPLLVHLYGDLFCCIWVESKFHPDLSRKSGFRCVTLRISKQPSLRAVFVSTQYYPTDFHFSYLDCILLDRKCSSLRSPREKNIGREGVFGQQNEKEKAFKEKFYEIQKLTEISSREGEIWRSCPPPLPDFKKSVIFRALTVNSGESLWYVLNLSNKKNERLSEMFRTCKVVPPNECSSVVLDNIVYSVGGGSSKHLCSPHFKRSVWWADLNRPERGWKTIDQKMIGGREEAALVAFDGKIYVFGGLKPDYRGKKPWGEVFDRNKGQWTGLADPPVSYLIPDFDVFAFVMNGDKCKIFVTSYYKKGLYVYNILSDSWEVFDKDFNISPCSTTPALAGTTLYWVGLDKICGYDLNTRKHFFGPIDSLEIERCLYYNESGFSYRPVFFNLHGEDFFGMIWVGIAKNDKPIKSEFHCTYLRVSRHITEQGVVYLKAFSIYAQVYPTDVHLIAIDGIISNGEFGGMRKLERCSTSESREMENVGDSPL